jgi:hypothetical protein
MKRYGSSNNLVDNFSYTYYTGTNRLQNIGTGSDYTYDANGNVTFDNLNRNNAYKYDWRNLLTEIRSVKTESSLFGPVDVNYWTLYLYDESGNRIRKMNYKYVAGSPPGGGGDAHNGDSIVVDQGDGSGYWVFQSKTFYVRDISGKEIAIYNGNAIEQCSVGVPTGEYLRFG